MRIAMFVLFAFAAVPAGAVFAADIKLPTPQKYGGTPLYEAMDQRGSATNPGFPSKRLDMEDFSTILWAASGHNRDGKKWTVPMANGRPPYCKVYLALDEGVFLYDWSKNILKQVSTQNVKDVIPSQDFVKKAPASLYIVSDSQALAKVPPAMAAEFSAVLAGAMSQNIYLACEGIGVGTRVIYSIDRALATKLLKLDPLDVPFFVMPLGKR